MSTKQDILNAIRQHKLDQVNLPNLAQPWTTYADRRTQFAELLETVGGRCVFTASHDDINEELQQLEAYRSAKKVCSLIEGVGESNVDLDAIDDPHDLEDVDFAIARGQFAVAENGAVWVTGDGVKHRAVYFITQHLALVVPVNEIVDNMHQAYERLSFQDTGFGTFISGPSKTADIEQSLVIGAHGPRSLTVFLTGQ